jgi:hypothetical protein
MTPQTHTFYEILKDFQPAMAALIALGAAVLAYFAAMARINYDRRTAKFERINYRLGLYLRLRLRTLHLRDTASVLGKYVSLAKLTPEQFASDMRAWPQTAPDLDEAWSHLEVFPKDAIGPLGELRDDHERLSTFANKPPDNRFNERRPGFVSEICERITKNADQLLKQLEAKIIATEQERDAFLW